MGVESGAGHVVVGSNPQSGEPYVSAKVRFRLIEEYRAVKHERQV